MIKMSIIKKVKTYDDLEGLGIGRVYCDISYRGGGIGFYGSDVARAFDVSEGDLPGKFGAYCNYLGGGLRGSINASEFSSDIIGRKAKLLEALAEACVRAYDNIDREEIADDPINTGIGRVNQKSAY
jgi:hypothetical protein